MTADVYKVLLCSVVFVHLNFWAFEAIFLLDDIDMRWYTDEVNAYFFKLDIEGIAVNRRGDCKTNTTSWAAYML